MPNAERIAESSEAPPFDDTAAPGRFEAVFHIAVAARISLGLITLGWGVLLLPQGLDVVRGLVEDTNPHLRGTSSVSASAIRLAGQWIAFVLACIWTGLNAWYWPRILIRQRVPGATPHWFKVVLRVAGLLPLLAAIVALIRIAQSPTSLGLHDVWIGLIVLTVALLLLATFFVRREDVFSDGTRWYSGPSKILDGRTRRRSGRDSRLTRGDDAFFLVSLALGALMVSLLSFPGARTSVSQALGSAALAFGAIGILIAFLSTIAWAFGRTRMPVLPVILTAFVACGMLNDNHAVRALGTKPLPRRVVGMEEALDLWRKANPDGPIILVAAAGGASRAGYWTAAVLRELDRRTRGAFGRHVFAISAVSGGSLGAVGYAARLADAGGAGRCHDPIVQRAFDAAFVGADHLAPAIGGLLYPDLVQRFVPAPVFPDRAEALEESWERAWRSAAAAGSGGRCAVASGSDRMARSYGDIWKASFEGRAGWVPLVLVNGTLVENGKRIITAPVRIDSRIFEDSYDFFAESNGPIRASTAVSNGARFPIVSPAGTLIGSGEPKGRIVDGGYFENGGLETMLDLARFLAARMKRERRIILIEIDNGLPENSSNVPPDFQRYPNRSDDETVLAIDLQVTRLTEQRTSPFSEVTSIVGGLYGTRSSRGVLAAKRLSGAYAVGIDAPVSRITFNLPRLGNGAAMSWSLSPRSREDIDDLLDPSKNLESIVTGGGLDRALAECQRLVADRLAALLFADARVSSHRCPLRAANDPKRFSTVAAAVGLPL